MQTSVMKASFLFLRTRIFFQSIQFIPSIECIPHSVSVYRSNLGSVVLQLFALGIEDIQTFDFMDKPSQEVGYSLPF